MIKALLQIKTLSTEAVTALSPLINDEELQLAGIAGFLDPIGEQLAAIYTMSESCMANISRAAVLTNLKFDPPPHCQPSRAYGPRGIFEQDRGPGGEIRGGP